MARGNDRQDIVHDDDRRRIVTDLARARWEPVGFLVMTNRLHLLVRIPSLRTAANPVGGRPGL